MANYLDPIDDNELVTSPSTSLSPVSSLSPNPPPEPRAPVASPLAPAATPLVDWAGILTVPIFYGREEEQTLLAQWVIQEHCRVICVLGMGGIGKSALVMNITHQLVKRFEVVIFRSLHNAPSCEALLDDCLQVLSPHPISTILAGHTQGTIPIEKLISRLLELFSKFRVLMVLDNLEGLLEPGDVKESFRPGFEAYEQLLYRVAETRHQSCLLLTSREKPASLRTLVSRYSSVRSLRLSGLDVHACQQLLQERNVLGTQQEQEQLIEIYAGHPLALKMVTETVVDLFGGEIGPFLAEDTVLFSGINSLLDEQFVRLSPLEQSVFYWLAIMREPVTLNKLQDLLILPLPRVQILEAIDAGYRRSLIERGKRPGSFILPPVVLEYVTQLLIVEARREIQQCRLDKLIQYGLEQALAEEYVRQMQVRLLISPLLTELRCIYPIRANVARQEPQIVPMTPLEEQLLGLLDELREQTYDAQGYGPANLIALLRVLRGHLSGLDLSQLSLRGAYLQDIEIQDSSSLLKGP